mmetsp:Transcript_16776/g.22038  ORF Transcript_16776/g.22038 Transcript_16776/m.22038 type:complete len:221 (-) Transcript_16776:209-871(-)
MRLFLVAVMSVFFLLGGTTLGFSQPAPVFAVNFAKQSLEGVFNFFSPAKPALSADDERRQRLKEALLMECECSDAGTNRGKIEEIIAELAPLSPVTATAESNLLQKKWLLVWTTEKEINAFITWGISGDVSQTINGNELENMIPFRKGGGLGVSGSLSIPENGGKRTNFKFTTAALDFAKWGKFNIPPIGEGWFDTLYLDEDLRVDANSRDDILICAPFE